MMIKVHTCKESGQTFLSGKEFDAHINHHLQKHLDEYAPKIPKKTPWEMFSNIPEGMRPRTRLSEQRACKEKKAAEYAPQ